RVGGDDDLAFALAFYSPDHPFYEGRLVNPRMKRSPNSAVLERGWAALCFGGDTACIAAIEEVAARARRFLRSEFVVHAALLDQPGASQRFTAIIVPPSNPIAAPPTPGVAKGLSAAGRYPSSAF